MYATYDVYTPELSAAPILWKAVCNLQGTRKWSIGSVHPGSDRDVATLYTLAKRLARLVSIPLTLHRVLVPALKRTKKKDPLFHKHDNAVPEVSLVATVIVVMKMVYGMDGKLRYSPPSFFAANPNLTIHDYRQPQEKVDPACALPALKELLQALREAETLDLKRTPPFSMETSRCVRALIFDHNCSPPSSQVRPGHGWWDVRSIPNVLREGAATERRPHAW